MKEAPRPGDVLNQKYRLDRSIGEGGMGVVFAATHLRNERSVAIKLMNPSLSRNAEVRARFLREGYVANRVGHPGVVDILDDDVTADGLPFLVMELLHGRSLESILDEGRKISADAAMVIADQVLDVLKAAHRAQIVHRDLKPGNIFITRDGRVKVLDFGVAHCRGEEARWAATELGVPIGTPDFMPPEQALGGTIDARSDIWSLGATLYALLTGHPVHAPSDAAPLLVVAATHRARPVSSVAPHTPLELAALIDRALAFSPADRWPSADAMQQTLRSTTRARRSLHFAPGDALRDSWLHDGASPHSGRSHSLPVAAADERHSLRLPDRAAGDAPKVRLETRLLLVLGLLTCAFGGAQVFPVLARSEPEREQSSPARSLPRLPQPASIAETRSSEAAVERRAPMQLPLIGIEARTDAEALPFGVALPASPATPSARTLAADQRAIATALKAQKRYDDAIAHYQQAYELLRDHRILYEIAVTHFRAGNVDEGAAYLDCYAALASPEEAAQVAPMLEKLRARRAGVTAVASGPRPL